MALCSQVVDLVGLDLAHQTDQTGGIGQIAIVQGNRILLDQVVDTSGVGDRSTADNAVDLVALLQQKLCQIGTVLTSDTSNQCFFHVFYSFLKNDLSFDVLSVFLSHNYILWILVAYLKC